MMSRFGKRIRVSRLLKALKAKGSYFKLRQTYKNYSTKNKKAPRWRGFFECDDDDVLYIEN